MKNLIIALLFAISLPIAAQNVQIKKVSIQDIDGVEYYVSTDTIALTGEIVIRLMPVSDQVKLLEDQAHQIEEQVKQYEALIDEYQGVLKQARARLKEIEKLQGKLQAAPKTIPSAENKTVVDPDPAPAKPKKKRKQ